MANPVVAELAADSRLLAMAREQIGHSAIPFSCDAVREVQPSKLADSVASGYGIAVDKLVEDARLGLMV